MKILALHPGHNATAGVFENGCCVEYHHEERFSNLKNHTGFPYKCLEHILRKHPPQSFTDVIIPHEGFMSHLFVEPSQDVRYEEMPATKAIQKFRSVLSFLGSPVPVRPKMILRNYARKGIFAKADIQLKSLLKEKYDLGSAKVEYFDHHTCHALTPVFFYGLDQLNEKSLLLTADGAGGDSCSKIFVFDPKTKSVEKIAHSFYPASLGLLYALTTQYLGMKAGEHEYKVMGLAAYSSDDKYWRALSKRLGKLIAVNETSLTLESDVDIAEAMPLLKKIFDEQRFDNIAAAVQDTLEEKIVALTKAAVKKTGIPSVAFSGGVFMNVKMNQKLAALSEVSKAFFQPSSGDESLGIGGAAQKFLGTSIPLTPIRSMYTGIAHSDSEIERALASVPEAKCLKIENPTNMERKIAELLAEFEVVARFDGRGEWGARSLCNRAILANASDMRSFYMVNDMVKMRDFWMPFAPSILMDWGPRYIADWETVRTKALESSKYMIITVNSTPLAVDHLRAAIHQKDKTLRPQMVEERDNLAMFNILKNFESAAGMGGIMNTSFNLHGFPLVGSPEWAIKTFVGSGLRYLSLGKLLISKN